MTKCRKISGKFVQNDHKNMQIVTAGDQVMIGGNETYVAMCHRCWHQAIQRQKKEKGDIL